MSKCVDQICLTQVAQMDYEWRTAESIRSYFIPEVRSAAFTELIRCTRVRSAPMRPPCPLQTKLSPFLFWRKRCRWILNCLGLQVGECNVCQQHAIRNLSHRLSRIAGEGADLIVGDLFTDLSMFHKYSLRLLYKCAIRK